LGLNVPRASTKEGFNESETGAGWCVNAHPPEYRRAGVIEGPFAPPCLFGELYLIIAFHIVVLLLRPK
jgi:hypothetical protein